jgi:signal peptidase I
MLAPVTPGQHGGRDAGHDPQAYPPHYPHPDDHPRWGAGASSAAGGSGHDPGYPPSRGRARAERHAAESAAAPGHPGLPGSPDHPGYSGYPAYPAYPEQPRRPYLADAGQPAPGPPGPPPAGGTVGWTGGDAGWGRADTGWAGGAADRAGGDATWAGGAADPAGGAATWAGGAVDRAGGGATWAGGPDDRALGLADHPTRPMDRVITPGDRRRAADEPTARRVATGRGRRRGKGLPLWQEIPLLLVIAFCLAILVRTFLLQAFYIPSGSMEDTLIAGDRVLVNKVVYHFREPARGEVVVFRGTDAWAPVDTEEGDIGTLARIGRALGDLVGISRPGEKDFIKRVIGLPGDTVSCCDVDGRVFVNGQPLDEDYVIRDSPLDDTAPAVHDCRSRRFDEVVVQPGHMFVMGDHRQVSQDSRCQGQVPIENVIGRAFVIVWPNDRWSSLSQPDTFENVPPPTGTAAGPLVPAGGPGWPAAPAQLAFVLPILAPVGWTFRADSARSRLIGRRSGRRLAE